MKKSTADSYKSSLGRTLPVLGAYPLDELAGRLDPLGAATGPIAQWKTYALGKWAASTVSNDLRVLKMVLRSGIGTYYDVNPGDLLGSISRNEPVHTYLSREEFELVNGLIDDPMSRKLTRLLAFSGCRIGETLALRVRDVAFAPDLSSALVTIIRKVKTKYSKRTITVSGQIALMLWLLCNGRAADAPLFHRDGRALSASTVDNHWRGGVIRAQRCATHPPATVLNRWGRRTTPAKEVSACSCPTRLTNSPRIHDLRHTHVFWLRNKGWRIRGGEVGAAIPVDVGGLREGVHDQREKWRP